MKTDKKTLFKTLKEQYPTASIITIDYYGGGDNFDSFHSVTAKDSQKKDIKIDESDFLTLADDYLFHCLDNSNADFNNDGCEGTITLDLDNFVTSLDNYEFYTERSFTGTEHF